MRRQQTVTKKRPDCKRLAETGIFDDSSEDREYLCSSKALNMRGSLNAVYSQEGMLGETCHGDDMFMIGAT